VSVLRWREAAQQGRGRADADLALRRERGDSVYCAARDGSSPRRTRDYHRVRDLQRAVRAGRRLTGSDVSSVLIKERAISKSVPQHV
jgi:hypothetical protein